MTPINIVNIKATKFILDEDYLLSSTAVTFWKDIHGCYLGCNDTVAEFANLSSVKDIRGGTDLDFCWRDNYDQIIEHDSKVKNQLRTQYYIYPVKNAKDQSVEFLHIIAPLLSANESLAGIVGISISLDQPSFNQIMSQFVEATEKFHLKLNPRLMLHIITQGMQLNNCHNQWQHESELFDYGDVKFSLREAQCLHYLLNGFSAEKTSQYLHISRKTVEFHIASIKKKLGCQSKAQLVNKAIDLGCIDLMFMRF